MFNNLPQGMCWPQGCDIHPCVPSFTYCSQSCCFCDSTSPNQRDHPSTASSISSLWASCNHFYIFYSTDQRGKPRSPQDKFMPCEHHFILSKAESFPDLGLSLSISSLLMDRHWGGLGPAGYLNAIVFLQCLHTPQATCNLFSCPYCFLSLCIMLC